VAYSKDDSIHFTQSDILHGLMEKENTGKSLYDICINLVSNLATADSVISTTTAPIKGVAKVGGSILDNTIDTVKDVFGVTKSISQSIGNTLTGNFGDAGDNVTEAFWGGIGVGYDAATLVTKPVIEGLSDTIKSFYTNNKSLLAELEENKELVVTVLLTVLMTKEALPAEALGYSGAKGTVADDLKAKDKMFQTDQSVETTLLTGNALRDYPCQYTDVKGDKQLVTYAQLQQLAKDNKITPTELNSSRSLLCVDHCAMSIPSKEMMDYVYRGKLFSSKFGGSLDFFGSYDMEKVKSANNQFAGNDADTTNDEGSY